MKTCLVQSNYWHNPGIKITLQHDHLAPEGAIHVEMALEDVLKALQADFKHPLLLWSRKQLKSSLEAAMTSVLEKMKHATSEVM
jgi:hypothetical protein